MSQQKIDKKVLVGNLLDSLHYDTVKEDTAIINHLSVVFNVPGNKKLRDYLIETVDFSELFSVVLQLVEPFAQMMNEIYGFLAEQRKTARSLEHVVIGENIKDNISFDLETFPHLYQPVIQRIEGYLQFYSLDRVLNDNISPLFLTEGLLGCGHCNDIHYKKTTECRECGSKMRIRFEKVFQQLEQMIDIIPDNIKSKDSIQWHCGYFETARKSFRNGSHWSDSCHGYKYWSTRLDEIEQRIALVSKKQPGFYDLEILIRFFELPFWKERNRLYEIWVLIHFVRLLKKITRLGGATFKLNIKDSQWHLMYGDAREPIAWVRGKFFEIEIWYQHKLKTGLKMFPDLPVEPEMLLIYRQNGGNTEPLVLIECKERKDYDIREVVKLSAFYRDQVSTALNIFCNYFDYSLPMTFQMSRDKPPIILCSQFRPGGQSIAEVDREFAKLMHEKLYPLHSVLVDVSTGMRTKDFKFVYQKLDDYIIQLSGTKGLNGMFSEKIVLCDYSEFVQKLRYPPEGGKIANLKRAIEVLIDEMRSNTIDPSIMDLYIITNLDFSNEDWNWLESRDANAHYRITFVARKTWVNNHSKQRVERLERSKLKLF